MNILVIGKNGQLATALAERCRLHQISAEFLGHENLPVTSMVELMERLEKSFLDAEPDVVINTAAYTNVEMAEEETLSNYDINSRLPLCVALMCCKKRKPLIHISTDFVFDGRKNGAYSEDDVTNPLNAYGKAKLAGEEVVLQTGGRAIVIRTSWLFSRRRKNFITSIIRRLREGHDFKVVDDEVGAPTFAMDLAEVCLLIAGRIISEPGFKDWGVYNYSGTPNASRFEVADFVRTVVLSSGLLSDCPNIEPVKAMELGFGVDRPKNSILDNSKIVKTFNVSRGSWKDEIRDNIMDYFM
ncbi:dTDP-4-dehydrorhamnose reductase [uncultured Ruminobacter sp.]|uniref:dTDP-4-dehydrorhamnose reductase n=1 Tax=uncultured Ruminobacter sp. TaxID=538947 RepID=UPI0026068EFB|nr:dTDP-4-dehydrorhamnose reductase [uncultured Ruminobacter sp.]